METSRLVPQLGPLGAAAKLGRLRRFFLDCNDRGPDGAGPSIGLLEGPAPSGPSERGVALLIALFILALLSILVVDLTYSTFLGSRLNTASARALQAEYLLKSAMNVARVLVKEGESAAAVPGVPKPWEPFLQGQAVPADLLGINEPNLAVALEITPEEAKLPLRELLQTDQGGTVNKKWRTAATRMFRLLGFDEDNEKDHTGLTGGKVLQSEELVALLIDYMDADHESYQDGAEFAPGMEAQFPEGTFSDTRIKRVGELSTIPGFTPKRMRKLQPLSTVFSSGRVNINYAPPLVLQALHEDIDKTDAEAIVEARKATPFDDSNKASALGAIIGDEVYQEILTMVDVRSRWFQVLAKVDYGTSTFFMRSYISQGSPDEMPKIRSVELF